MTPPPKPSDQTLELTLLPPEVREGFDHFGCEVVRRKGDAVEGRAELWFETPVAAAVTREPGDIEPFLMATLMIAMFEGRDVVAHGRVSLTLLANLEEYMAFWHCLMPETFHAVALHVDTIAEPARTAPPQTAVAAFSGGMDASYLVWRHHSGLAGHRSRKLTACVMIEGFDIRIGKPEIFGNALARSKETLDSLGIPLVHVRTNFRELFTLDWGLVHGTVLIACLTMLKDRASCALVGSAEPYRDLVVKWGSSPVIDHLLSSTGFEVRHDSAEFTRSQKAAALSKWTAGVNRVRVCWYEDRNAGGNCGRCEKCLRSIANFVTQGLPVPASLGGNARPLERGIFNIKLRSEPQYADWRSIQRGARSLPWSPWRAWLPVLFFRYHVRRVKYALLGKRT